jgi:hypothetical protein
MLAVTSASVALPIVLGCMLYITREISIRELATLCVSIVLATVVTGVNCVMVRYLHSLRGNWYLTIDGVTHVHLNDQQEEILWKQVVRLKWCKRAMTLKGSSSCIHMPWWIFGSLAADAREFAANQLSPTFRTKRQKTPRIGWNVRTAILVIAIVFSLLVVRLNEVSIYARSALLLSLWVPIYVWASSRQIRELASGSCWQERVGPGVRTH